MIHRPHLSKPIMNPPVKNSDWASEFNELSTNESFNHVYNQKKKMNHSWNNEFIEKTSYDHFNDIYNRKEFLNKSIDDMTNEFDNFKLKEKEDADNDDSIYDDDEIKELASKFNAYKDPRFRQSEFFKLMEKVSERKSQSTKINNDKWTDEFMNNDDNKWANDFINDKKEGKWSDDFIDSNYNNKNDWVDEYKANQKDWIDEYEEDEKFWTSGFNHEHDDDEDYEEIYQNQYNEEESNNFQSQFDDIWSEDNLDFADHTGNDLDQMIDKPYPYPFTKNNQFMNEDNQDLFGIGLELYKKGDLMGAIEAFEACIKKNDDVNIISDSYFYLGISQAENDRDDLAIIALLNSLKNNPNNKNALLSLSVSYANEMFYHKVFECLMKWLSLSDEYSWILKDCDDLIGDIDNDHDTVSEAFIKAARMRPYEPDPDVQIALGLLYNVVKDYDRSIDCFKSALIKRKDDYQLWNKLGATQANNGRYEDAIESYFHALNLRPTYTRTRFNLGVSFAKLNDYTEAAKSVLGALSINPDAIHIWDFLGMIFKKMGRDDLKEKSLKRDVNLFADDFNF